MQRTAAYEFLDLGLLVALAIHWGHVGRIVTPR
jgi:hypothetical protein